MTLNDLLFLRSIGSSRQGQAYQENTHWLSGIIWFGLLLLVLSGIMFVILKPQILQSQKVLAKLVIVGIILINGFVMNLLLHKKFDALTEADWSGPSQKLKELALTSLPLGIISLVSWYAAVILGAAGRQNWTIPQVLVIYLVALLVAYVLGRVHLSRVVLKSAKTRT